jgi:hypothetical protein
LTGNGDILSYEDLDRHIKETQVKGCMIARFDYLFGSPDLKGSHELLPSLAFVILIGHISALLVINVAVLAH